MISSTLANHLSMVGCVDALPKTVIKELKVSDPADNEDQSSKDEDENDS